MVASYQKNQRRLQIIVLGLISVNVYKGTHRTKVRLSARVTIERC